MGSWRVISNKWLRLNHHLSFANMVTYILSFLLYFSRQYLVQREFQKYRFFISDKSSKGMRFIHRMLSPGIPCTRLKKIT